MIANTLLPLMSSLVSFVFALLVLDQWVQKRRSFQLVWGIGLIWYGTSAGAEFLGSAFGWSEPLYRTWYLIGALFVAAYLGVGTVYLLSRTRFGYFVGFSIFAGGLFAFLSQLRLIKEGRPTAWSNVYLVAGLATLAALAIIYATARYRAWAAHLTMGVLAAASLVVTALVVTAPIASPGYALDAVTHVPIGSAMPGYIRIVTGPFNIAGALCLVGGALFSAYVYMPKRKALRAKIRIPVLAQLYGALQVVVNTVTSLPRATAALFRGQINSRVPATFLIALGGFIPGVTSGLNRFGVTWSFFLGEFLGVLFIFVGFLVSEEVFRNLRVAFTSITLWQRAETGPGPIPEPVHSR